MQTKNPEQIAAEIVDQLTWTSNVMRDGRLIGLQFIVADAIAKAIHEDRARSASWWRERHARIVEGEVYKERYRKWPQVSEIGNRGEDDETTKHCLALAAIIRRGDQQQMPQEK